jgi:FixJ family two-component response regulator
LFDHQLTAVVVDDTLTVRKLMEKLLLKMGFARVDFYEKGSKGLTR